MPQLARYLPLPERYYNKGVRRYGFHGISYEYLLQELNDREQSSVARHHVIMAHLGNGSSLVALKDGIPMDTTMSFTPTSGVMMGSRTGDLDPGLITYLLQNEGLTKEQFSHLVNHESGLKGISGISGDVLELLVHERKAARQHWPLICIVTTSGKPSGRLVPYWADLIRSSSQGALVKIHR